MGKETNKSGWDPGPGQSKDSSGHVEPPGVQPQHAAENGQAQAFTHWEKLPQSCPHRLGLCCLTQVTECGTASVSSYVYQMNGYHPADSHSYKSKWIRLWKMKQFVPKQRGTGVCCCQEATKQEPSCTQYNPYLSPGSGKAWPIVPTRKCRLPPPARCLAIPKGCRLWLQILLAQTFSLG